MDDPKVDDWAAGVVMRIMLTIDGGRREWSDPIGEQVVAAVAAMEAERDHLRQLLADVHGAMLAPTVDPDVLYAVTFDADGLAASVANVVAERDRLRAELSDRLTALEADRDALSTAFDERDRLRDELKVERQNAHVAQGYFDEMADKAEAAEAERDRLRAVVAAVAICGTCNYCQRRAHAALDGSPEVTDG